MDEAVIRWCDHGESVRGIESSNGCSGCVAGICGAALACFQPEPDPVPTARRISLLPRDREIWARLLGAALGLGSFALFGRELLLRLLT